MSGRSSPALGRRSPFSSASPLEREAVMNSLNAQRSLGNDLGDMKSRLLGGDSSYRLGVSSSDTSPRKHSLLGDSPLTKSDSSRRSPLIEDYSKKTSNKFSTSVGDSYKQSLTDSKSKKDAYQQRTSLYGEAKPDSSYKSSLLTTGQKKVSGYDETSLRSPRLGSESANGMKSASQSPLQDEASLRKKSPILLGSSKVSPRENFASQKKSSLLSEITSSKYDDVGNYSQRTSLSQSHKLGALSNSELQSTRDSKGLLGDSRISARDRSYTSLLDSTGSDHKYDSEFRSSKSKSVLDMKNEKLGKLDTKSSRLREKQLSSFDMEDEGDIRQGKDNKSKRKKKKSSITANIAGTRYDVVRQMVERLGYSVTRDEDPNAYIIWNDSFVSTERISELKPYQRINHFPGMGEICRKDCLARNMAKLLKQHPDEFSFVPKTWIVPSELSSFQNYVRDMKKKKKSKTFIAKPSNGAMGNGISLFRNPDKIPSNENMIIQEYVDKPLLVEGYKCDMRIYVLVTSCDPLRAFLFNDGLLRMSTEKYVHPSDHNIDHLYMHLTNYSVNKHNELYDKTGSVDAGSKRTLRYFNEYLRRHDYDVAFLWRNITDMLVKTLIVSLPHVLHSYRMCRPGQSPTSDSVCFEILGFDVMLDRKLRPWLLEVNRSPSFGTDEKLDYDIKSRLIEDSLRLLNIKVSDKRKNIAAEKAQTQKRLTRPSKRGDDMSELEKKRQSVERKREELKDMLQRLRKEASREDFENRNCGHFKRIFPPEDKFTREKYASLISDAFSTFHSGRTNSLQQEISRAYNNKYREEDLLDMLAQCEADEKEGLSVTTNRPRGPKPLQSMPSYSRDARGDDDEDDDDENSDASEDMPVNSPYQQRKGQRSRSSGWGQRPISGRPGSSSKAGARRSKSLNRSGSATLKGEEMSLKEQEEEFTKMTLTALNDMRIKFPGKTDDEADFILDKLHENWKFHKPRIASYWLVKLDSIKRRKVIDIVRSNVRAVVQRTWKSPDVDTLRSYRIFNRVFNRLLWSHGQGLWNCFQTSGNSWEMIFSKSTDTISAGEMACCRRIVQLCRDCLLIVYQFAAEAKNNQQSNVMHESHESSRISRLPPAGDKGDWAPVPTLSQRISRLYNKRSQSLSNLSPNS